MTQNAAAAHARRILIAGVGNVLQGDDGFGVVVAQRLMRRTDLPDAVKVIETGIGGMTLIQELMQGYDALIILDAFKKGGAPGKLYLLEPELPDLSHLDAHALRDYFSDTHYATPMRALNLLARIDRLPATIRIVGCEPEEIEELKIGLSAPAAAAVDPAIAMVVDWVDDYLNTIVQRDEESAADARRHGDRIPSTDVEGTARPLYLIVGARRLSPCDQATFGRFKLWVARRLAGGKIDLYAASGIEIEHWDDAAAACSPHLLNPCECGTFLPIEVEPGPMLSSAIGLMRELYHLNQFRDEMEPQFQALADGLWEMAQLSLATNTVLEVR